MGTGTISHIFFRDATLVESDFSNSIAASCLFFPVLFAYKSMRSPPSGQQALQSNIFFLTLTPKLLP